MKSSLRIHQTHYQIAFKPTGNVQLEKRINIEKHYIYMLHETLVILKLT